MNADSPHLPPAPIQRELEAIERPEFPKRRSRTVADCCAGTRGEYGCESATVCSDRHVSDRVYAPMHSVQSTPLQPSTNRLTSKTGFQEIPARDHTMLALREGRDQPIDKLTSRF
jgi:hypothetical protein